LTLENFILENSLSGIICIMKRWKVGYNLAAGVIFLLFVFSPSFAVAQEEDPVILNNLGVKLLGEGKPEEAVSVLERARAYDPAGGKIASNLAGAYMRMAERTLKEGNAGGAARWADNVLNLGIDDAGVLESLARTYNLIANAYNDGKDYSNAASILETALTIEPGNSVLRSNLGMALYHDTRREEALREFRSIMYDDPKNTLARRMCGLILYDMGEMKQALEELRYAAAADPHDSETVKLLRKVEKEYAVEKDFGVDRYQHFTVSIDGGADLSVGSEVIDALESAYGSVGRDLNYFPDEKIAVVIYPGRQFHDLLNKHKNVGGIYDGKIRVPVGGLEKEAHREQLRRILAHEYAHVVVHFLTNNNCPLWLNEGIAEYESRTWEDGFYDVLGSAASNGTFVPLDKLSSALKAYGSNRVSLAYLESFSLVRYMAQTYGVYSLRRILDCLYRREPVEKAVRETLFVEMDQLERDWMRSLGIDS